MKIKEKQAQRQTAILQSALTEFSQKGVAAARMQDIAQNAGIAKGTLYLYFDSKNDLLDALIETYAGQQMQQIRDSVIAEKDCQKALYLFVESMAEALVTGQLSKILLLLITNVQHTPHSVSLYHDNIIQVGLPLVKSLLQRGVDEHLFKPHDSDKYARLLVSPAIMEILYHALFSQTTPLEKRQLADVLHTQLEMVIVALSW